LEILFPCASPASLVIQGLRSRDRRQLSGRLRGSQTAATSPSPPAQSLLLRLKHCHRASPSPPPAAMSQCR